MAAKRGSAKAKPEYVTEVSVPSGAQEEVYSKPYRGRPASANMDNSIEKIVDIAEIHRGVDR